MPWQTRIPDLKVHIEDIKLGPPLEIRISPWCECWDGTGGRMRLVGYYYHGKWIAAENIKEYRRACLSVGAWLGGMRL